MEETITKKSPNWKVFLPVIAVLFLTIITYWPLVNASFVKFDDDIYVVENQHVIDFDVQSFFSQHTHGHYQPLTMLSYSMQAKLGGGPSGFHIFNLLLHLLTVVLVFLLIRKLVVNAGIAWLCALLFALHPIHVESVAWISARNNLLSSLFLIAGLLTYLRYVEKDRTFKWLIFTFLLFLGAVMSKSLAVTFPLLMFVFDFIRKRRLSLKSIVEKIPFALIAVFFAWLAMKNAGEIGSVNDSVLAYSMANRAFMIVYAYVFYICWFIFPLDLSVVHYNPFLNEGSLPVLYYLAPLALLIPIILLIRMKSSRRQIFWGFAFYFISISLTVQFVPVGNVIVSERYAYFPHVGLLIVLSFLFLTISRKANFQKIKPFALVVLLFFISLFAYRTNSRARAWENSDTLFQSMIDDYPEDFYGYMAMGNLCKMRNEFPEAIGYFDKSIFYDSAKPELYNNRGLCKMETGDWGGALFDFTKLIQLEPESHKGYYNRGITKYFMNNPEAAIPDLDTALMINPDLVRALLFRGNSYFVLGDTLKACSSWMSAGIQGVQEAKDNLEKYCINQADTSRSVIGAPNQLKN
ncbi:MAG: hypothetical protein KKA07_17745 [Bacteroidetes bacterium]|nr:hypothetical protein [Bacteroidota bacterium]MBU1720915.1 hypothetical protein [Bacteroidota bacterium]